MQEIMEFKNGEFENGIQCYEQDGTACLNLDAVARGLGFTQVKNGVEYVRWERVNGYLAELGFCPLLGKDSYIPENIFYRLAMKAKNDTAEKFQAWIADEIDLERGKYVRRVWQAEFDGSKDEAWAVSGTTFYSPSLPTNMKFRDGVSNKYAVRNDQNIQCVNFGRGNTALCVANPSEYDGSLDDKGLSNFKAHLAANPLVVMTYLDTPIERDLTSAELAEYTQLYSYKPTTVVENDSDCWMDVTALCKPK